MSFVCKYNSPIGTIIIASDGECLTGLYFEGQKYIDKNLLESKYIDLPIFEKTKKWLDVYFSGKAPKFTPPILLKSVSQFRKIVWDILAQIPFGKTTTYGEMAKQIEEKTGKRVSPQAVGGAVSHNPISIIIPCHRVLGTGGNLTGYAGGIDKKLALLKLDGHDTSKFKFPKKSA